MAKPEKLASNLMMNIIKIGKTVKSEKLNFSDMSIFSIFVIFIFKLGTNFPDAWPKLAYFFNSINFFGFIHQKNTLISVVSQEN